MGGIILRWMFIAAWAIATPVQGQPLDGQVGRPSAPERRKTMKPQPRGDALLRDKMLSAHNDARALVGQKPLAWDDGLMREAAAYAATLADEDRFEHSEQDEAAEPQGENLWMGTRGAYTLDEMIDCWVSESRFYRHGPVPDSADTENWAEVAHYTQIVWRDTTAVGCAIASNHADDFLVCRYSPAGNVVGELAYK